MLRRCAGACSCSRISVRTIQAFIRHPKSRDAVAAFAAEVTPLPVILKHSSPIISLPSSSSFFLSNSLPPPPPSFSSTPYFRSRLSPMLAKVSVAHISNQHITIHPSVCSLHPSVHLPAHEIAPRVDHVALQVTVFRTPPISAVSRRTRLRATLHADTAANSAPVAAAARWRGGSGARSGRAGNDGRTRQTAARPDLCFVCRCRIQVPT